MKRNRHKNQIAITGLAVMIAVAGYLNFSDKEMKLLGTLSNQEQSKQEEAKKVSDKETALEEVIGDDGEDMLVETSDETADNKTEAAAAKEEQESAKAEETAEETAKAEETASNSLESSDDSVISAKVEDEIEDTVSVSSSSVSNSILQAKLSKEQSRSKNKEMLMEIVNSEQATKEQKQKASNQLLKISDYMEKEEAVQEVLATKGYPDCMVSVSDDSVDVAVKKEKLSEVDRAKIEDVVTRKTGMSMQSVVISSYSE